MNKQNMSVIKRSKILFLTILLTIAFFAYRLINSGSLTIVSFIEVSSIVFFIVYIGALWVEDFTFKKESLYFEILQLSFFVAFEFGFMQAFFSTALARLYEALLLMIILIIFFFSTYFAFLTMNLFIVSRFKNIPLLDVATTTSYIYTIITSFYITYTILSLSINPFLSFFILFMLLSIILFIEINTIHISYDLRESLTNAGIIGYMSSISVIPASMWNRFPEFISLLPAVIVFVTLGALMHKEHGVEDKIPIFTYIASFILVIYMVVIYR